MLLCIFLCTHHECLYAGYPRMNRLVIVQSDIDGSDYIGINMFRVKTVE